MCTGIYVITFHDSDKFYVGSSADCKQRAKSHENTLKRGKHHNKHLQNAFNKRCGLGYSFEVVQTCEISELLDLEQQWIESFPFDKLYNVDRLASNPMTGVKRAMHTESYNEARRIKAAERARKYRAANPELTLERDRAYKAANRELLAQRCKARRAANPELNRLRDRELYAANVERKRENARVNGAKRIAANREGYNTKMREYRAANKDKIREINQRQYAKRKAAKLAITT